MADGQYARMAWLAVNRYFKPQVVIPMHYGAVPGAPSEAIAPWSEMTRE